MRTHLLALALATAASLLPCIAAAQSAQSNRQINREANMRFAQMDANRDGIIQRREWRGSAQSFRVHDWDGDGVLSREEVRIGARRAARGGEPGPFDSWEREYEFTDWTDRGFRRLDANSDGRVTRQEFPFDVTTFNRADHNRDGSLSREEFLGGEDPNEDDDREDSFWNLDHNQDNRIDRSEWHGSRGRFDAHDDNRDGFLTLAELRGTTDAPPDLYTSVDRNRDGRVTKDEWYWDDASFIARDLDRDGRISREEVQRTGGTTANQNRAHAAGYERGLADGHKAGQQDRVRGWGWNLEGRSELQRADAGYTNALNARAEYQAGYRDGFRQGYRQSYDAGTR